MRKHINLVIFFFASGLIAFGQKYNSEVEKEFGEVRAEIVTKISELLEVPDSVKEKISFDKLDSFKDHILKIDSDLTKYKILHDAPIIYGKRGKDKDALIGYVDKLTDLKGFKKDKFVKQINELNTKFYNQELEENERRKVAAEKQESLIREQLLNMVPGEELDKLNDLLDENQAELESLRDAYNSLRSEYEALGSGETVDEKESFLKSLIWGILLIILAVFALRVLYLIIKRKLEAGTNSKENKSKNSSQRIQIPVPKNQNEKKSEDVIDTEEQKKGKAVVVESPVDVSEKPEPEPKPIPAPTPVVTENEKNAFAFEGDDWIVVGASVIGKGHVSASLPCQDNHKYEYLGDGWGIAIVSDGAGSAANSHIGSKLVAYRAVEHFQHVIKEKKWMDNNILPTEDEWKEIAFKVLKQVRTEMELYSEKIKVSLKSLAATAIVVIHSPLGLLVTHVGDGRAGYKNKSGEWKALMSPHKGEEANQTLFLTSEFWDIPFYKTSGVYVPESKIINEKPFGFILMSDGCEATAWQYNYKDEETGRFYDPNKPHQPFVKPLDETLQSFKSDKEYLEVRKEKWWNFLDKGNKSFENETDDKTMILGVIDKDKLHEK